MEPSLTHPLQNSDLTAIGRRGDLPAIRAALAALPADGRERGMALLLAGCRLAGGDLFSNAAVGEIARGMLLHDGPETDIAQSPSRRLLLAYIMRHAAENPAPLQQVLARYGLQEATYAALWHGIESSTSAQRQPQLHLLAGAIAEHDRRRGRLAQATCRSKYLRMLGGHAPADVIIDSLRHRPDALCVTALWDGATLRAGHAVLAGVEQRAAVCTAVFAHASAVAPQDILIDMCLFVGQRGDESLLRRAAETAGGNIYLIAPLYTGVQKRAQESINAGKQRMAQLSAAVINAAPQGMTLEPPLTEILYEAGQSGDDALLQTAVRKFYHEPAARKLLEDGAKHRGLGDNAEGMRRYNIIKQAYDLGPPPLAIPAASAPTTVVVPQFRFKR